MKTLFLATANKHKVEEISAVLSVYGIKVFGKRVDFFEPDFPSLKQVAEEKARQAFEKIQKPLIVEDTGVYFEAYDNFPGGLAKRVFQSIGFEGLLALIRAGKTRKAFFRTVICHTHDGKKFHSFEGELSGTLLDKVVEPEKNRLPYEKIFIPLGHQKALAELSKEEKNKISHRAVAAKKLGEWVKKGNE